MAQFMMNASYLKSLNASKKYLDENGYVRDPPGDVYVFDSNNNLVASSVSPPLKPLFERVNKVGGHVASMDDLKALKEAIGNDPDVSYQKQFIQATALAEKASSWDCNVTHELTALRWCWNVLLWRPRKNKSRVGLKNPLNPYTK